MNPSPSLDAVVPFALLLRQQRVDLGFTQAVLAERAGLSARAVQHLEAGLGRPYSDTVRRLADALGLGRERRLEFETAARPTPRLAQSHVSPELVQDNLPLSLTSFVGRERETADVQDRLVTTRLITLVGEGGSGKTRLALEVVRGIVDRYPDGVWLVELASLSQQTLVPHQLATVLGVREGPRQSTMSALVGALRERHVLVVLDNCEHVIAACAELAHGLLAACRNVHILATSREMLGTPGEVVWRVHPLSVPLSAGPLPSQELVRYEAVRLFVDRANAASPSFALSVDNAADIAEVCSRLDGIPLAIELAAARIAVLSVADISARLDDRFRLLVGGTRTAMPRHRTLRGMLDWSYSLLSEPECLLFERLAVFAGGCTLEAAEAITPGHGIAPRQVLDLVGQLVAKSMVAVVEKPAGDTRYRMLETIRQYAAEKLHASVSEPALRRRHVHWFLARAEQFEASLDGPDQTAWLDRMEDDLDNLRAALQWTRTESGEREAGLRLGAALGVFWWRRGHAQEGGDHLEELLADNEPCGTKSGLLARTRALTAAGFLLLRRGAPAAARPLLAEALALARALDDKRLVGIALTYLGEGAFREGDAVAARPLLEEALKLAREVNGWLRWYILLMHLGSIAEIEGAPERARSFYREGLDLGRRLKDAHFNGLVLQALGSLELNQGNLSEARACLEESLITFNAAAHSEVAQVLASFAGLAAAESRPVRALRLAGGTQALRRAQGAALQPVEQARLERQLESAMQMVDEATASQACRQGESMTREELVAYALESPESQAEREPNAVADPRQSVSARRPARLSPRELEVAALLARGLSNRDIAAELVISEGTTGVHVKHILAKLGFTSRGQITAWAVRESASEHPSSTIPSRPPPNT